MARSLRLDCKVVGQPNHDGDKGDSRCNRKRMLSDELPRAVAEGIWPSNNREAVQETLDVGRQLGCRKIVAVTKFVERLEDDAVKIDLFTPRSRPNLVFQTKRAGRTWLCSTDEPFYLR